MPRPPRSSRSTGWTAAARSRLPGTGTVVAAPVDEDLVAWGRVLRLETTGRVTGRAATATVGFVERADGALLVAAGSPGADWGRNLLATPACRVTIGDATWTAVARPLSGAEHATAVRELILRYGTPAEGLGAGPSFELRREPG